MTVPQPPQQSPDVEGWKCITAAKRMEPKTDRYGNKAYLLLGIPLFIIGICIGVWGAIYFALIFIVGFILAWCGFAMVMEYMRDDIHVN